MRLSPLLVFTGYIYVNLYRNHRVIILINLFYLRDCLDHNTAPMDGQTLADAIHNRGINIRYLGKVTGMIQKVSLSGLYVRSYIPWSL